MTLATHGSSGDTTPCKITPVILHGVPRVLHFDSEDRCDERTGFRVKGEGFRVFRTYLRRIDFVYHSTLGLRVNKKREVSG